MKYPDTTPEPTARTRKLAAEASFQNHKDAQLADQVARANRTDANLGSLQFAARDRILKLSCELWDARQRVMELEKERTAVKREGFKAGWRTSTTGDLMDAYLIECEQEDFERYEAEGIERYLAHLEGECE